MSSFYFKNLQRVILPASVPYGVGGVQGIIIAGSAELDGMPRYDVQFVNHLKRAANGHMESRIVSVSEADLVAAQPPAMVTEEEATRRCKVCFDDGHMSAMETIRREREARARKRKKPAKAKSKSKRWGR